MEYLKMHFYGKIYDVAFGVERYAENDNLALEMVFRNEDGFDEPFTMLTVNLSQQCAPNCAYVDTNDNPWAEAFIAKYQLGHPTGRTRRSGFCEYPEYEFDMKKIEQYRYDLSDQVQEEEYLIQNQHGVITVQDKSTLDNPKFIRFITPEYKELFSLPDEGQVLLCYSDGTKEAFPCKYLDEYHFMLGHRTYHICEFAERMRDNGTRVEQFPEKRMIWSNIDLDLKDLKEELKADYPDLSEEEYSAMMIERNGEYLSDERENLNIQVDDDILVIGDIGRWDGRRMGYKTIETGKLSDCLSSECDYAEWYVDRDGEFRGREIHHDGTNYMYYRKFKESADYDDRAELMDQIYHGVAKQEDIDRLTEKLGETIGAVYGWEFPTRNEERVKAR